MKPLSEKYIGTEVYQEVIDSTNGSQQSDDLVNQLFQNHYDFYKDVGIDLVKSGSEHVNQVSIDYQGRVLYELLQNAFDRAEHKILVRVEGNSLFVANDGKKFTYNAHHDYKYGSCDGEEFKRSDFHSLCSISTSNKIASESIGNKGVGFKSVYALGRYANIHTKGIIKSESNEYEKNISFRLYDIFDKAENIPPGFDDEVKSHLTSTIESIQLEYEKRGVPGYYFPERLGLKSEISFEKFDKELVTVIEVPFDSEEEVMKLIEQIDKIHFEFVGLKYSNNFRIEFETPNTSFTKRSSSCDSTLFSASLNRDKIESLATKAGIDIGESRVAIKFKKEPNGLFYNYLSTEKNSPFKYVDFHADFHTTVDRKDINFRGDKVGAYNKALLDACLELYFSALRGYSDIAQDIILTSRYIIKSNIQLNNFSWNYIALNDAELIYQKTRELFGVDDYLHKYNIDKNIHYTQKVLLLSSIAKKYFEKSYDTVIHKLFFMNIVGFIHSFTDDYNTKYSRSEKFKKELFIGIRHSNAKVIPGINLAENKQVIYRENGENRVRLPDIIPIKITDFEITDPIVKSALGVTDYTQSDEILKHFKQCAYSGYINEVLITEDKQKEILNSCYELYLRKEKSDFLSSHRYATALNTELRRNNLSRNQANFNISTLFLKLVNGKYKPAQLCVKSELDLSFLDFCDESKLDKWLRFLGVSTETKYRFVDVLVYNKLKDGVDELPQLLSILNKEDRITGTLISNMRVVSAKGELTHPAVINDNNYSFLKNISSNKLKPEFDNLLVKNYNSFPTIYRDILREKLDKHLNTRKNEIIQFYQNVFEVYAKRKLYLVIQSNQLIWVEDVDFYTLGNKFDFELCTKSFKTKKILAYYLGRSEFLKEKIITPKKGEITYSDKYINSELKNSLIEKIAFILISLSHSKNSEINYLSERADLSGLQTRLEQMVIYNCAGLKQDLTYGELGSDNSTKAYAYKESQLFLSANSFTNSQAAQGICDYLFSNISIKDQVELIVYHKELEDLVNETDKMELQVINRKWRPDYQEKFIEFQQKILAKYNLVLEDNKNWFEYSKGHQNSFLINLTKEGRLKELKGDINSRKDEYEGYFETFKLDIDYTHIYDDIISVKIYCDNNIIDEALKKRLNELILKAENETLGIENEIEKIKVNFPEIFVANGSETQRKMKEDELKNAQSFKRIHEAVKRGVFKNINHCILDASNQTTNVLDNNHKKIIFQGGKDVSIRNNQLEVIGVCGEEQVLVFLIQEFMQLSDEEQLEGIDTIRLELKKHTRNAIFEKYAEECKKTIGDNEQYTEALIQLFYVAKECKYAYFDLITYRDGKPILVEVKTTNSRKSKSFFLSIAEVNIARSSDNYEIVRVTPRSIIFMGNPIKEIDKSILEVKTNGFLLKPRNYEFIIK